VPVYYDLKFVEGTWFWSFKLNLTKVKIMWIGYPHMPTEQGAWTFEKLVVLPSIYWLITIQFVLNDNQSLLQVNSAGVALELNSLRNNLQYGRMEVGMVLEMRGDWCNIESKKIWTVVFFGNSKEQLLLNSDKSWFDSMKQFTKNATCWRWNWVYKYIKKSWMFGLNYQKEVYLQKFIDQIFTRSLFYSTGNYLWSNGEGYIRFALCVKEEKSAGSN
jgi:hypothetical protein